MPTVLTLENITINDEKIPEDGHVYIMPNYDTDYNVGEKPFKYGVTKKLVIKNCKTASGRKYELAPILEQYSDMEIVEN
jgi:hypothetical protein